MLEEHVQSYPDEERALIWDGFSDDILLSLAVVSTEHKISIEVESAI